MFLDLYKPKFENILIENKKKLKGVFLAMIISKFWKKRTKRFVGPYNDTSFLFTNRMRYSLTYKLHPWVDIYKTRVLNKTLKAFLLDVN